MWERHPLLGNLTALTGLAILSTICRYRLSVSQSELISEVLCWIILPSLFKLGASSDPLVKTSSGYLMRQSIPWKSVWLVAIGVTALNFYLTECGIIRLLPLLSPVLLAAQSAMQKGSGTEDLRNIWSDSSKIIVTGTASLSATIVLSSDDIQSALLSSLAAFAQLVVYLTFMNRSDFRTSILPQGLNIEENITSISKRMVFCLTSGIFIQAMVLGIPAIPIMSTISLALAKALSWYFIARTSHFSSWCIAPVIQTFCLLSNVDPFTQNSGTHALLYVVCSLLSLFNITYILPPQAKARYALFMFVLIPIIPYWNNIRAIRDVTTSAQMSFINDQQHPVEVLFHESERTFRQLLQRQSINSTAARDQYKQRYGREPPGGFEEWYQFAIEQQSPLIDDFDSIDRSISPFFRISGKEVIEIMNDTYSTRGSEVWYCKFSGETGKTSCHHPKRTNDRHITLLFDRLLGGMKGKLPEVTFLVNHLDEPRILIPPLSPDASTGTSFNTTTLSHQPSWEAVTKHCNAQDPSMTRLGDELVNTFGLPFVQDTSSVMDLCQHRQYQNMHGLFMRPTSLRLIEGLVPVLSTGAPSTMGDILFPSPAYIEDGFRYEGEHDIDWDKKHDNLYWAGSTTGGFAMDDQWRYYQRQRFVALAQNLEPKRHAYLREKDGDVGLRMSSFLNSRLFDVAFTRFLHCQSFYCRAQKFYFRTKRWADRNAAFRSKLTFDTDGNGVSGRFYQLLASKSLPLKQTLLREWHDERLMPWVHYIPVSQDMEELPELINYLTLNEKGQNIARQVAQNGRDWSTKAFREVDFSIYVYRLFLELARLQDPDREVEMTL